MLRSLTNRFLADMKSSWRKTAVLGVLVVVGLFFWIPPLFRAVAGGSPETAAVEQTPKSKRADKKNAAKAAPVQTAVATEVTWQNVDDVLAADPLARSMELAAVRSRPFQVDPDQFSPPVLFAEADPLEGIAPAQGAATRTPVAATPATASRVAIGDAGELVLKSTIVGVNRRAALINKRLYYEGAEFEAGGETYRVTAVYPRRVVLSHNGKSFELLIARPNMD